MTTFQRAMIAEMQHRANLRAQGYVACPFCDGMGFTMSRYTYVQTDCRVCKGLRLWLPPLLASPDESA